MEIKDDDPLYHPKALNPVTLKYIYEDSERKLNTSKLV